MEIPAEGEPFPPLGENIKDPYWVQTDSCAGFDVSEECQWRIEEM